jgi:hypothetical protein
MTESGSPGELKERLSMSYEMRKGLAVLVFGLASVAGSSDAQTVERDTKVTGPKGRSIERKVDITRSPGKVERDIKITRPSGTFERDTVIRQGGGGPVAYRNTPGGPRNVFIENDVFIAPPAPGPRVAFGLGGPNFGLFLGGPPLLPPPVVIAPPPFYVGPVPPPTVIVQPPVRYAAPVQPQTIVADPVAAAMDRLKSTHDHSRRDGALTLGRLGDARAVPALIERVDKDWEKEVRVAASWALGEIGDPRAAITLQKAMLYDKKQEVRDAANIAYKKLGREKLEHTIVQVSPPHSAPTHESGLPEALPSSEPPLNRTRSLDPPPPPRPDPPSNFPK